MLTLRLVRIVLPTLDRAACGSRVAALLDTWQRELAYAAPGGPGPAGSDGAAARRLYASALHSVPPMLGIGLAVRLGPLLSCAGAIAEAEAAAAATAVEWADDDALRNLTAEVAISLRAAADAIDLCTALLRAAMPRAAAHAHTALRYTLGAHAIAHAIGAAIDDAIGAKGAAATDAVTAVSASARAMLAVLRSAGAADACCRAIELMLERAPPPLHARLEAGLLADV